MDTIRLRTLTLKSVLGFGKYADMTVHQVLSLKHTRVLRWYYYNCSMISFIPDVLDFIDIKEDERIDKPGKDPDMFERVNEEIQKNLGGLPRHIVNKTGKSRQRENNRRRWHSNKFRYSKSYMQSKNHGH